VSGVWPSPGVLAGLRSLRLALAPLFVWSAVGAAQLQPAGLRAVGAAGLRRARPGAIGSAGALRAGERGV